MKGSPLFRGAHATRVLFAAPRRKQQDCALERTTTPPSNHRPFGEAPNGAREAPHTGGQAVRFPDESQTRAIPAVGKVLEALGAPDLPRPFAVQLVRQKLASLRARQNDPGFQEIVRDLETDIIRLGQSRLQPVINGTGILIHTNFGRAPLGSDAIRAIVEIGSSLQQSRVRSHTGARGNRAGYLESGLSLALGSEAATVVNNCAAALVLIVGHFPGENPK